ncbi:RNA polymerase sigma factor [Luteimonas sp. RIT-PG2_3]
MTQTDTHRTIDAIWRFESPKIVAALVRMLRDIDTAEELAQDALVSALERWPRDGVPDNPGAWLMATAKHRAIDRLRQYQLRDRKHVLLAQELDAEREDAQAREQDALDDDIGDDLLRLIFVACHPVLSLEAQVALTLRLLGGLTTPEIARAFLVQEATIAQRIVRAKRTLSDADIAYEVPRREDLPARMEAVLGVVYLVFNEGYSATAGDDLIRPALCDEALRLGRLLVDLLPQHAEAHGLLALMEIQASRARARVDADGVPILLQDQDRARWDHAAIARGLVALERAGQLSPTPRTYALQAAIAACHARATTPGQTDWARIAALYALLAQVSPSPIVELNRAVAIAMAQGPAAGLRHLDGLREEPALQGYPLLAAVEGDLLERLGRHADAAGAFAQAATLSRNARERDVLRQRAQACAARQ